MPFVQTRKAIGMVWTVTVQNWNKSFTRWHRTSCRNGWPRGFGSLIPNPLLLNIYFRLREFQSSFLLIYFRYGPNTFTLHQNVADRTYIRYKPLHFRDRLGAVRDWSKSIGGLGRSIWKCGWLKNTWPTPSLWLKNDWPTPKARLEIAWPTP